MSVVFLIFVLIVLFNFTKESAKDSSKAMGKFFNDLMEGK